MNDITQQIFTPIVDVMMEVKMPVGNAFRMSLASHTIEHHTLVYGA